MPKITTYEALKVQAFLLEYEKNFSVEFNAIVKKELEALYNNWKRITITMLKDYDDEFCYYDRFQNDSDKVVEHIYKLINEPFTELVTEFGHQVSISRMDREDSKLSQMQILEITKEQKQLYLFHRLNNLCDGWEKKERL